MTGIRAAAVVLDIEGTVGALTHVRDVLFPYARTRLEPFFRTRAGDPRLTAVVDDVRAATGRPDLDAAAALGVLTAWADDDVKAAPLKTLQGWIWAEGYARGELQGHVYPEVPATLRAWRAAGVRVCTYSSGSVQAQRDWFRHTPYGDLTGLLDDMFDLGAGAKTDPASYRGIADRIGVAGAPLFLSDAASELDAATAAGWTAVGVRRVDDARGGTVPGHHTVATIDHLTLLGEGGLE